MEPIIGVLILLVCIYPYFLVMRFLQLGCKAFKKYLSEYK